MRSRVARRAVALAVASLVAVSAGCAGSAGTRGDDERSEAAGVLALLPDEPELRRHLLLGDLERLRSAYSNPDELERALAGVWFPDALSGSRNPLWRTATSRRRSATSG